MKKLLLVSLVSILAVTFVFPTSASDPAEVTATVTPKLISIKIANGYPSSVDYGVWDLGSAEATPISPTADPVLRVENNGNIQENFRIRGADATATGSTWELSDTQGSKMYIHKFGLGSSPLTYTPLTKTNGILVDGIDPDFTQDFKLKIEMPSSTDSFEQHSTTVTVIAESS